MRCCPASADGRRPPTFRESAGCTGRRIPLFVAGLAACAAVVLAAGGCGSGKLKPLYSEEQFNFEVLKADRPVLVHFGKAGCLACAFLGPCMDTLADEYRGRVAFTTFEMLGFWSDVKCPTLWRRYHVALYPTVVLFVGGREKYRWVNEYNGDAYRKVLNEVAGPPIAGEAPAAHRGPPGKL
jgi:hypothetical protein